CNTSESAKLEPLSRRDEFAQLFAGEKEFFGCESDVVGLIDLAVALGQSFVKFAKISLDARRLVHDQNCIAEMIEDRRGAPRRERHQPLPTGKCFAFVG